MKLGLPLKVNKIIHTLQEHGYEAYAVGGCVRDMILGRTPQDYDITTSAMPLETKALFPKTFDTGIAHGTITVLLDGEGFEVTTYRIDGKYEDNRHPKEVTFTRSLKEDLLRRDFTINAMAFNEEEGLVDIFGGQDDLENHVIRCVGNAQERFAEDALRVLRAIRFSGQLGFEIDRETEEGIRKHAENLQSISAERIQVELVKLLTSAHPERIRDAYRLGITKVILPEFDRMMETPQETPHHLYSVGEHTIRSVQNIEPDKVLRLTMLLHDTGKPEKKKIDERGVAHFKGHAVPSERIANEVLLRLKFDNDTIRKVTKLVYFHDYRFPPQLRNVRRAMRKIDPELFPMYLKVRRADMLAQSTYQRAEKMNNLEQTERLMKEVLEKNECVSLKQLEVGGKDLIAAGIKQGPQIGEILKALLEDVLDHPEHNTKDHLLNEVKEIMEKTGN